MIREAACGIAAAVGCVLALVPAPAAIAGSPTHRFDTVVIDAGHGGSDGGAYSPRGYAEKTLVLEVARLLATRLRAEGLIVVQTREDDTFVPLETRTAIANDASGDLFLSIHANAASDPEIHGTETFFLSLEASDEYARRVALRENAAFGAETPSPAVIDDPLIAILGDMIANEHARESSEFARLAQARLGGIDPASSRGVKQAPFVVLMGVQMPASLVEIGFITNLADERTLHSRGGRQRIVEALAESVREFGRRYDERRGAVRASRGAR